MKVIFLDFDGVINNWNCFNSVDYNNVNHLSTIVKITGAKIVATTSSKYSFQRNLKNNSKSSIYFKYIDLLEKMGIEIFDVTPYVNEDREQEINEYLKLHPEIEEFLILDDDYIIESLIEHQVFLDLYKGICEEHIEPSVNILNGILGFYPNEFDFNETTEERYVRINNYHSKNKHKK